MFSRETYVQRQQELLKNVESGFILLLGKKKPMLVEEVEALRK
jgi:hypothetical protein